MSTSILLPPREAIWCASMNWRYMDVAFRSARYCDGAAGLDPCRNVAAAPDQPDAAPLAPERQGGAAHAARLCRTSEAIVAMLSIVERSKSIREKSTPKSVSSAMIRLIAVAESSFPLRNNDSSSNRAAGLPRSRRSWLTSRRILLVRSDDMILLEGHEEAEEEPEMIGQRQGPTRVVEHLQEAVEAHHARKRHRLPGSGRSGGQT